MNRAPTDLRSDKTVVEVRYPEKTGQLALRGNVAPLSWEASTHPVRVTRDGAIFELSLPPGEILEFKVLRGDAWSKPRNYTVLAGDHVEVHPYFDHEEGQLEPDVRALETPALGRKLEYQVLLPPSYAECSSRRYPVLYAQDGHVLFEGGGDDHGPAWGLDRTLAELWDLGAVDEMIVVGVRTGEDRARLLTPMPDPEHGGGDGPKLLDAMVERLVPAIDAQYRTIREPRGRGVMGASLGGLFSFFAAWSRSDVFAKAACLSSSFWWADRGMIRAVREGGCPVPRPLLYIDSGAAKDELEDDLSLRDGYHHTVAMRDALVGHCYEAGVQLHLLAFPGQSHSSVDWAARVSTPLQLLFPRTEGTAVISEPVVA
jgi:predicted alpha/beta superfamily hydrolase